MEYCKPSNYCNNSSASLVIIKFQTHQGKAEDSIETQNLCWSDGLEVTILTPSVACKVSRLLMSVLVDNLTGIATTPSIKNNIAPQNAA